ncbi:MAG: hypothetical protein ACLUFN_11305 [Eubacterium sp.]
MKQNKSNVAIIIALILFFPLGLYWMWAKSDWKKVVKIIITAVCIAYCAMFIAIGMNTDFSEQATESATSPSVSEKPTESLTEVEYTIEQVEDLKDNRFRIHAFIPEGVIDSMSEDEIKGIIRYIAKDYCKSNKVNMLTIFLYIQGDKIGNGATVGYGTYAPYGKIARSDEVKAGDYSTFDFDDIIVYSKEDRESLGKNSKLQLQFGTLLDFTVNNDNVAVIKAKITPSYNNKATINQNYHSIETLAKEGVLSGYSEVQYWAVADMTNGNEEKVISFTVSSDLVSKLEKEQVAAIQLGDYVEDLWVHPSLREQ